MKNDKKEVSLTPSQQQELKEWDEKIKSGEAYKIAKGVIIRGKATFDPESRIKDFAKNLLPKMWFTNEKLTDEENEKNGELTMSYGIENGLSMMEAVEARYRGMMKNLRDGLVKEYNCITYSEKALVDLAINAYSRNLTLSKYLVNTAGMGQTSANLNNFLGIMSKDIDRANRHFITALETLKQLKQPELKVNIKTNTAFVSQNQQFNNSQAKNETNEVK